jgi:hypothetical protein
MSSSWVPFQQHLSPSSMSLVQKGYEMMKVSKDPYHDHTHIDRMLADLKRFLDLEKGQKKVNPEVLLLSTAWHDSWKSGRVAGNEIELLYHQFMDGLGSVALFEDAAKKQGLASDLIQQVSYAIRKHAHFQFTPIQTEEAKLLRDLDDLDLWSVERLNLGKDLFIFAKPWKVKFFLRTLESQVFHTDWAHQERQKRKDPLYESIKKLLVHLN